MSETGQYDEILLSLAQRHDGIESFLDVRHGFVADPNPLQTIFNFFARRTDLYHVLTSHDSKTGFPPGVAQKMV